MKAGLPVYSAYKSKSLSVRGRGGATGSSGTIDQVQCLACFQIQLTRQLDLETGKTLNLINGPGGACRPTPSPDGKTLAFVRRVDGKSGLHVFDIESGAIQLLYDNLERDMHVSLQIVIK